MVPKLFPAGKSFKKLAAYLLHDAEKAKTAERVRWTHTLNLASDRPASAIDEMLWTIRGADWLKQQSNVPSGGRPLENPVKHFSLNWHPSETPTREQMIEAVEGFLLHMGWREHQAVIVCHDDKHPHVHVMLNAVHPETGRALDTSFEKRRAQEWAKAYEREHGVIFCEERLKPKEERQASPTREAWEKMKRAERDHDRTEYQRVRGEFDYFAQHDDDKGKAREWEALKAHQRVEREAFFKEGKQAYRSARNDVFREVRAEFRAQWNAYYAAMRSGGNKASLAEMKLALIAAQSRAMDERRQIACDQLREKRDHAYDAILAQQKLDRAELGQRQRQGLRTPQLMDVIYPPPETARPMRDKTAWHAETNPSERAATEKLFDRAGRAAIDPADHHRIQPGVFRRGSEPAAPTTDGFGREPRESQRALGRKQEETVRSVDVPRTRAPEVTETSSEKARVEKAREMTDQASAKSQTEEAAALRASWNKHRWRSRD
jgi:Relaxase/Mobilisation nuclease domain